MSMVRVALIITISSSYSGIFEGTGLLNGLKIEDGLGEQKNHRFWYDPYDVHGGGDGGLQSDTGDDAGRSGSARNWSRTLRNLRSIWKIL